MTSDARNRPPSPVTRHPSLSLFAVSPPGFEDLVAAELRGLGMEPSLEEGGVAFFGAWEDAWRANLWCRVAGRVLVRVAAFEARGFQDLERGLGRVAWAEWLPSGCAVDVRAASHRSRLWHTGKVAEVVAGALAAAVGARPGRGGGALGLLVRAVDRSVTVSLDTSGEHLHRRGYRAEGGRAPIRENLAAGLLLRAGWDGSEPFLDPMCGSGTLAVEAALLAQGAAPGGRRRFAFEGLPSFRAAPWDRLREEAEARAAARVGERPAAPVLASDRDVRVVRLLAAAARAAGVEEHLQVAVAEVGELEPPAPRGLLAANPPYGRRLGGASQAYAALGSALRGPFRRWRWAVVTASPEGERALGLAPSASHPFRSGGLRLRLALGKPVAMRSERD